MEKMMVGWPEKYQRESPEDRPGSYPPFTVVPDTTDADEDAEGRPVPELVEIGKRLREQEEVRSVSATGGEKGVKLARFDLIPPGALEELAKHYGRGARKYDDNNWRRGYEWGKSFAAAMRHMWAFWRGEDIDPETGTPHVIAAAWHMFSLYEFMQEFPQFDTRYKK